MSHAAVIEAWDGGGDAGEPHRQVVDRLEVPAGRGGDLGVVRRQVEHVPDRVVAAGDAGGLADPGGQRPRVVAGDRPADALAGEADAPVVLPHDAVADRHAVGVDRHGAGPLAGDAHGHDPVGRHVAVGQDLADGVGDDRPPLARVLHGAAAVGPAGRRPARGPARPRRPATDTNPTFGPPVPRSTARTRASRPRASAAARARRPRRGPDVPQRRPGSRRDPGLLGRACRP